MDVPYSSKLKIEELEKILQVSLRPMVPSPDFVRHLRQRLTDYDIPVVQYQPTTQKKQLLLLAIASLISGVFLLLTGSRLILALLGSIGLLQHFRRQAQEKISLSPN
jgi:hypothetical protein